MRRVILASFLLTSLVGWNDALLSGAIARPVPTPRVLAQQRTPSATTQAPIQVKLLNPGTGDRQLLRFKPAVGTRQLSVMSLDQTIMLSMMGKPVPSVDLPIVNTTLELLVTKVEENGDIHCQFRYPEVDIVAKPGMQPTMLEMMRSQMKNLQSIRGTFVMSDRGQMKSANFELPESLDPMIRLMLEQFSQSLNQLSFPLPAEAVGAGAKWQTTAPIEIAGMKLTQTGTYELVTLKNPVATLTVQVIQQAPPQAIGLPGVPASTKVQLKKLKTEGSGKLTLDLTKPFVQQSTLSMKSTSQMSITVPKSDQAMDVTTQSTIQINFQPK